MLLWAGTFLLHCGLHTWETGMEIFPCFTNMSLGKCVPSAKISPHQACWEHVKVAPPCVKGNVTIVLLSLRLTSAKDDLFFQTKGSCDDVAFSVSLLSLVGDIFNTIFSLTRKLWLTFLCFLPVISAHLEPPVTISFVNLSWMCIKISGNHQLGFD